MNELDLIALDQSRALLENIPGVTVLGEWRQVAVSAVWLLLVRLELLEAAPSPYVAATTEWELVVDFDSDNIGKVQLYPANNAAGMTATFPHQMFNGGKHPAWPCRSGHLCTASGFDQVAANRYAWPDEPVATIPRILWHAERATHWLRLAAQDELAESNDPYELPDFNIPTADGGILIFNEGAESLALWQGRTEQSGIARLRALNSKRLYVVEGFFDSRDREAIYKPDWGSGVEESLSVSLPAFWLRLPNLPVVNRWQVPATIAELRTAIEQQGEDLDKLLEPLWKRLPETELLLLVGAPIPETIDGPPVRYHWQALRLPSSSSQRTKLKARENLLKQHLRTPRSLRWLPRAENWHPDILQNRGRLHPTLANAKVVMLGVGALGSNIAEQLVRMGLQNLTLIDNDLFEAGNLVRHTLTLPDLLRPKAKAVADRLNRSNPSAKVKALVLAAPAKEEAALERVMQEADLIVDVTANDKLLQAIPLPGADAVPFVSCSLGLEARDLFFYASLATQLSWEEFSAWYAPFRQQQNELAQQMELPRGVGCWQPLIPARLNRIAGLAGIAVELIEQAYKQPALLPAKIHHQWPAVELKPFPPEELNLSEIELSSTTSSTRDIP